MHLVFLGAPGSGKGSLATRLVERRGYKHISTGDLLRAEVVKATSSGKKINQAISSGNFVSDELVADLLKNNCQLDAYSYIFDGYPRNSNQISFFEDMMNGVNYIVIYFTVDTDVVLKRLENRRSCLMCGKIYNLLTIPPREDGRCFCGSELYQRDDDKYDIIVERIRIFEQVTRPVIDYFDEKGLLCIFEASGDVEDVYTRLSLIV